MDIRERHVTNAPFVKRTSAEFSSPSRTSTGAPDVLPGVVVMSAHATSMRIGVGVGATRVSRRDARGATRANARARSTPLRAPTDRAGRASSVRSSVVVLASGEDEPPETSTSTSSPPGSAYGGPNMYADSQAIAPPSPRRVFLGTLATAGLALGGNFLGITGALLSDFPDAAASLRLDIIYPVNGLKRCYNPEKGYEFLYPEDYLGDATMAARNANRQAAKTSLDPGAPSAKPPMIFGQEVREPQSAFGPMGGTGEENVSVIVSRAPPGGFRLDRFGDARNQAEWLLANVLARPGTGKTAELYDAYTTAGPSGGGKGVKYYTFEYTIRTESWYRHNVAVFAEFGGRLYTLVAQVPETRWKTREADFGNIARSFRVFVPTG
jgi:hypothetical protein